MAKEGRVVKKSWSDFLGIKTTTLKMEIFDIEVLLEAIKIAYPKMEDPPYYLKENRLSSMKNRLKKAEERIRNG